MLMTMILVCTLMIIVLYLTQYFVVFFSKYLYVYNFYKCHQYELFLLFPENMLRQYCQKVGIKFDDSMLNWDEAPKEMEVFQDWMPWFEGVLTSKTFQPSATRPVSPQVLPNLPKHVQKAIDENMPIYNKMHAVRLKPILNTL